MTDPIQTPVDPATPPKSAGRWTRIALAVSIAINLMIIGIVVGAVAKNGGPLHRSELVGEVGFGPFTEALSKDQRDILRRSFLTKIPEYRDARQAMRLDFAELLAQLRATPFDPEGLRAVIDRQNQRNAERLELGQTLIFDLLVSMDTEARQAFANRLEQSLSKGPKKRGHNETP